MGSIVFFSISAGIIIAVILLIIGFEIARMINSASNNKTSEKNDES